MRSGELAFDVCAIQRVAFAERRTAILFGGGTFFAQAVATGFVGHAATVNRGAASGLYLAFYFGGGFVGSAVLGQVFDRFGWPACVLGIALALAAAALLAVRLKMGESAESAPTRALSRV